MNILHLIHTPLTEKYMAKLIKYNSNGTVIIEWLDTKRIEVEDVSIFEFVNDEIKSNIISYYNKTGSKL